MKLNLPLNACRPERLESFLSGDLQGEDEREFTRHLSICEICRRSLEQQAAEPEVWMEAQNLLKPSKFDGLSADEVSRVAEAQPIKRPPLQIQNVLAALGPTDDPEMLGRLGGYEVSGVVGAGGMGVVLKAIDKSLDRTVAIKVLAPHLATSGAARKRFAREAKAAAAVLHPNVIAIHSVSNDESLPYLVMPYVRGTSLQKRLDSEGPLTLQEILRIGAQIAAGLAAAHAQGLVHRDIKPANILLEDGVERVTITDFGLARAVDDATITHSGVIAGTPQYMSPEQARGEAVDGRSDLFSLGSVMYAICAGHPPFRAETTYGVMRRITDDEPTSIRDINPDIPDWLASIIAKLMSKQAADRFASAAEVREWFEKCLAHVQQPATVPLPAFLVPPRKRSRRLSLSRHSLGVITMIATLFVGLFGMVAWQSSNAPDIAGKWTGDDWGEVQLEKEKDGSYNGTYTDTFGKNSGEIKLKWSRIEQRFNGSWKEGNDRFGKISVRLAGSEIHGAWTTSKESKIDPGHPRLSELAWRRSQGQTPPQSTVVEIYVGRGVKQQELRKLVASLNALPGVTVDIHEEGEGDVIKVAFVRDPATAGKKDAEQATKAIAIQTAIADALLASNVQTIRWIQANGKLQDGPSPRTTVSSESPPSDKPAGNSPMVRILNSSGAQTLLNDLVEANVGYPYSGLPSWAESPNREGLVSLEKLAKGDHWLLAAGGSGQATVFKVTLPMTDPILEQRLRAARKWTDQDIDVEPSVVIDQRDAEFGEIIAIDILNKSKARIELSEQDVELRAEIGGKFRDQIFILSPGWASADRQPFPPITIEPGQTGRLPLKWQEWSKSGLWVRRTGPIAEPGFPPPEPGRMWLRVRVAQIGFSLISVRSPKSKAVDADRTDRPSAEAKRVVQQMRGISMQLASRPRSDGKADPNEERKQEIMDQFRQLGGEAVPALVLALGDADVQMRRNAELVMIHLAGPYDNKPRIDIKEALPALLKATEDPDADVRAWAAHAIAEIGSSAQEAVPALIKLLQGQSEAGRNTSCLALGAIGPAASDALPALRHALDDPSKDVRQFAQAAIHRIESTADAKSPRK